MLSCDQLKGQIVEGNSGEGKGLSIVPQPDLDEIKNSGESSITLRLGRWFIGLRQSSQPVFDVAGDIDEMLSEARAAKLYFVPFGEAFVLHPGRFVLAATLEWMRFPEYLGGYVTGKSTWARRGLIIETAAGIHPGFSGCLTLELVNMGEVPVKIRPGMKICQIFIHGVTGGQKLSASPLSGRRRPFLNAPKLDLILNSLLPDKDEEDAS